MLYYLIVSYLVGAVIFVIDSIRAPEGDAMHLLQFRIFLWLSSPLTAWHGALHYLRYLWLYLKGEPTNFWILKNNKDR